MDWTIVIITGAVCLFVGMLIGVVVEHMYQKRMDASQ